MVGLTALLLLVGLWLYGRVSEVGWNGLLAGHGDHVHTVRLKSQPVYRVKKKLDIMGMQVIRIVSRQQPQEFLVMDGISSAMVDKLFTQKPDLGWANLMANQFLKLREVGGGDSSPVSVEIQGLKTLQNGVIQQDNKQLPYWQLEIRFKLSNEPNSRYYQAGIVRNAESGVLPVGQEVLLIGYAQKEAFQKQLLSDLMDQLLFEQN